MVASKDLPTEDTDFDEPSRRAERRALEAKKREQRFLNDDFDDELTGPRRGVKAASKPRANIELEDDWDDPEDDWEEEDGDYLDSIAAPVEDPDESDADADDAWGGARDDWRPERGRRTIYPSFGHDEEDADLD